MSLAALNNVRVLTSTTGQGTVTLGAAYSAKFLTEVQAGAANATIYRYRIDDGNDFEIGYGTYTVSGRTLTRTVEISCIGGTEGTTKLTLSGAAQVRFIVSAADYASFLRAADIGSSVQGYDANTAKANAAQSWSAKQTFTGAIEITKAIEHWNIVSDNLASGDNNIDYLTNNAWYFNTNGDTNAGVNFRGDGSNSLDSLMDVGDSITFAVMVKHGGTAYYINSVKVDSVSVTPEWLGAAAPSAGTVNKRDVYTFTIIKTAGATFIIEATYAGGN